ncbi:MAG: histidine phosphatase family protein [Ignavibacteriales bacterium]|jgi:phosphohistidine phosphatase|nr:histidine phosphatase family protein [Ignavibacteriales bacterium]MBK7267515.1 histidine phosphatase family protein [Ignavibacteriales bacterium]MBK8664170.1 histidine phosphatase family protein [Ignavibacteriales bacterium]MBP7542776.1 histidine phosphatase family protein [Ignavibacteriaceae bacterium]
MKTIYLVRHAKSDWDDPSIRDFDRPLNKRGKNNAPAMGKLLKQQGIIPELVITSTAMRAKTTAELVTAEIGIKPDKMVYEKELYLASAQEIFLLIKETPPEYNSVMIVAHNPGITELLNRLTGGNNFVANIPTCGVAELQFEGEWNKLASGKCLLEKFLVPKEVL